MEEEARIKFEREFAEEFAAYEAENAPQSFLSRFAEKPIKHIVLFSMVGYGIQKCVVDWIPELLGGGRGEVMWCLLIGVFLADFLTGFVHMYCDMTPLEPVTVKDRSFLQWAAFGFHYHHANMQNWNTNDIWYGAIVRAGSSFFLPLAGLCFILDGFKMSSSATSLILFSCAFSGLFVQYFHAAAHGRWSDDSRIGRIIKTLQALRIILPPSVHREHHKHFDRNFAILTGWSTPLLNWMFDAFFRANLDAGVRPEEQRRVYYEEKDKFVRWPYYAIFPKWRESLLS